MSLVDLLRDPNARRGACDDLLRAIGVSTEELAEMTLAIAGKSPAAARTIVADQLRRFSSGTPPPEVAMQPPPEPAEVAAPPPIGPEASPQQQTDEPKIAGAWRQT
jgi:hypothetical protein